MTTRLSIGMFTYSTKPRGSVVHASAVAEALAAAGHDVTLYALGKGSGFYRELDCRVEILAAADAPGSTEALVRQRQAEIVTGFDALARRHDVLHAQDCLAASALLQRRSARTALLVRTVHHVERFEDPYLEECQRRSIELADAVFSVSQATRRDVRRAFGRDSALVRNGVDLARFEGPVQKSPSWVAERFGAEGAGFRVLTVGGVEPRKNSLRALASVAKTLAERPGAHWVIVGGQSFWDHSEHSRAFETALASLPKSTAKRIVRAGTILESELTALYRLSDVLYCASEHEGFGLSVLEAMASGTCVAVPHREPFTEYLDASCAAFFDPTSVDDMSAALLRLAASPNERQELSRVARARATEWSWRRSADLHTELYEAVLKLRASAARAAVAPERESHA